MADRSKSKTSGRVKAHPRAMFNSMVASAQVVTSRTVKRAIDPVRLQQWQARAWDHYDSGGSGELRFGIGWIANGLSRVNIVAAAPPRHIGDDPIPLSQVKEADLTAAQRRAIELVEMIAGGPTGQSDLLKSFGMIHPLIGFVWLVAEPDLADPEAEEYVTWKVYSQDVLSIEPGGAIRLQTGEVAGGGWRDLHPNALVVKCWRPHARRPWEPDSAVRGVLDVLDQIDMLAAHITASAQSRLAGAGLLVLPNEIEFPERPVAEGEEADERESIDVFVDGLTDMMIVPIRDRSNASAVVPYAVQVPGEYVDKIKHISFSTPFDEYVSGLLDQAVKRLALGLDMPPEVLTGMSDANHWSAWQIQETAISLHIEPTAGLFCLALTEGYLALALSAEGFDPNEAIVWYDTANLTSPPDLGANATQAYDREEVSGQALRRYLGLNEDDAPDDQERKLRALLKAVSSASNLAPGLLVALGMLTPEQAAAMASTIAPAEVGGVSGGAPGAPAVEPAPRALPDRTASINAGAVLAAADGVVFRAMERAGQRLRTAVGRKIEGGPRSVEHPDVVTLHTVYDATTFADLDHLLEGAFDRVPEIAAYCGVDAPALAATLQAYCRALLGAQHPHTRERLAAALGVDG